MVQDILHSLNSLILPLVRINKKPRLNRRRQKLIPLNLLDKFAIIVINPEVNIAPRRPLPSRDKERVSIDAGVGEDVKQTLARILDSRELDPDAGHVLERLLGEDAGPHVPRRDDVHAAAVVVRGPPQRVHDPPRGPLGCRVLRAPGAVEEGGARPDEDEACVLLCRRGLLAVLLDEVVEGELGGVQGARDVDVCDAKIGFCGLLSVT